MRPPLTYYEYRSNEARRQANERSWSPSAGRAAGGGGTRDERGSASDAHPGHRHGPLPGEARPAAGHVCRVPGADFGSADPGAAGPRQASTRPFPPLTAAGGYFGRAGYAFHARSLAGSSPSRSMLCTARAAIAKTIVSGTSMPTHSHQ